MYKITIKGEAKPSASKKGTYDDLENMDFSILDGVECEDDFVQYCDKPLANKLVSGYMKFVYENEAIFTVTEYTCKEQLTDSEIDELIDYTQGQWSDGIGEGFEQWPCLSIGNIEYFISPWFWGQTVSVIKDYV